MIKRSIPKSINKFEFTAVSKNIFSEIKLNLMPISNNGRSNGIAKIETIPLLRLEYAAMEDTNTKVQVIPKTVRLIAFDNKKGFFKGLLPRIVKMNKSTKAIINILKKL